MRVRDQLIVLGVLLCLAVMVWSTRSGPRPPTRRREEPSRVAARTPLESSPGSVAPLQDSSEPPETHGLVFLDPEQTCEIPRRYDQRLLVGVVNRGRARARLQLALVNPHEEIQADFVGPGSRDAPDLGPWISPGEVWTVPLVVHAPDAAPGEYSMTLHMLEPGPEGAHRTYRTARLRVRVMAAAFAVELSLGEPEPGTRVRRLTIRNRGATLEDLDLVPEGGLEGRVRLEPAVRHAHLEGGTSLEVAVRPHLAPGFAGVAGRLRARSGAGETTVNAEFLPPVGQRLFLGRGGATTTAASETRYCASRGYGRTDVGGPDQPGAEPGPADPRGPAELGPAMDLGGTGLEGGRDLSRYPAASRPPSLGTVPGHGETTAPGAVGGPSAPQAPRRLPGDPTSSPPAMPPRGPGPLPPVDLSSLLSDPADTAPDAPSRDVRHRVRDRAVRRVLRAPLALGAALGTSAPHGLPDGDPTRLLVSTGSNDHDMVWSERNHRGLEEVAYSQIAPEGTRARAPVSLSRAGVDAGRPRLATAASGRILVTFLEQGALQVRVSGDRGATWSPPESPRGLGGEIVDHQVAAGAGQLAVAWIEQGLEAALMVARRAELASGSFAVERRSAPEVPWKQVRGLHLDPGGGLHVLAACGNGRVFLLGPEGPPTELPAGTRMASLPGRRAWLGTRDGDRLAVRLLGTEATMAYPLRGLVPATWTLEAGDPDPFVRVHTAAGEHFQVTREEVLRLPSRGAGATQALLAFEVETRWDPRVHRQHHFSLDLNGARVLSMEAAVPQGRFLVPVQPDQLRWDRFGQARNRIEAHARNLNPGHFYQLDRFRLHVRTPVRESFVFAASQAEADSLLEGEPGVNHGTPDLALGLDAAFVLPPRAPASLRLPMSLANRGDALAPAARATARADGVPVASLEIPALRPFELVTLPFEIPLLPGTATLEVLVDAPGDPEDDRLTLHFTSPGAADPTRALVAPARRPAFQELKDVGLAVRVELRLEVPGIQRAFRLPEGVGAALEVTLEDVPGGLDPRVTLYDESGVRLDPGDDGALPRPRGRLVAVIADVDARAADPGVFAAVFRPTATP